MGSLLSSLGIGGLPGLSSTQTSAAGGGTINFAPIYTGTAANNATASVGSVLSSPWFLVAAGVLLFVMMERH